MEFVTRKVAAHELQVGDVYLIGVVGGGRETRKVLAIESRQPRGLFHGSMMQVGHPDGTAFRAHMHGYVDVIEPAAAPASEWKDPYPAGCEYLAMGLDDCGI